MVSFYNIAIPNGLQFCGKLSTTSGYSLYTVHNIYMRVNFLESLGIMENNMCIYTPICSMYAVFSYSTFGLFLACMLVNIPTWSI
jgi:hypothetical protein